MGKLAINGGKSIRKKSWPEWPIVGKEELELISEVTSSGVWSYNCLLYTSPSPRDATLSRMPSSA